MVRAQARAGPPAQLSTLLILPAALMQFMGDQSKPRDKDELDLLYELLKVSQSCACWKLGVGGDTP